MINMDQKRFWIVFLLIGVTHLLLAQKMEGQFIYKVETVIELENIEKLKEQNKTNPTPKSEAAEKQIVAFMERHDLETKTTHEDLWTYYMKGNKVNIVGDQTFKSESYDLYDIETNERVFRRFHKNNSDDFRIDTLRYSDQLTRHTFVTRIHEDSTKTIRGYPCYKIEIDKISRGNPQDQIIQHYDIYLTRRLRFPMNPIIGLPTFITDHCAIEIKEWIVGHESSYNLYTLVDHHRKVKKKTVRVPKKFRKRQ